MNRTTKLLLLLITITSVALALGALGWRWREAGDVMAIFAGSKPLRGPFLLAAPILMTGVLYFAVESANPKASPYERFFVGLTLVTNFLLILALQARLALVYLQAATPDGEFVTRLAAAVFGLAMVVRANFLAKAPSPQEDVCGDWARTTRRTALILVATGLGLAACAVTLPMKGLLAALGGVLMIVLALSYVQRRTRRGLAPT